MEKGDVFRLQKLQLHLNVHKVVKPMKLHIHVGKVVKPHILESEVCKMLLF